MILENLKIYLANASALAFVTLADVEAWLKVGLLAGTFLFTIIRTRGQWLENEIKSKQIKKHKEDEEANRGDDPI